MQHIILITARIRYTGLPKQSDNVFRFPTINHIPICIRHKRNSMIPMQRTKSSVFFHCTDSVFRKPASTGTMLQHRYVMVSSFSTFSDTCIISRYCLDHHLVHHLSDNVLTAHTAKTSGVHGMLPVIPKQVYRSVRDRLCRNIRGFSHCMIGF